MNSNKAELEQKVKVKAKVKVKRVKMFWKKLIQKKKGKKKDEKGKK